MCALQTAALALRETPASPPEPGSPRLLDRVRQAIRTRHYSPRTEKAYVNWVRKFVLFHGKRHPAQMGSPEIGRFLSHLAVARGVSASTCGTRSPSETARGRRTG